MRKLLKTPQNVRGYKNESVYVWTRPHAIKVVLEKRERSNMNANIPEYITIHRFSTRFKSTISA